MYRGESTPFLLVIKIHSNTQNRLKIAEMKQQDRETDTKNREEKMEREYTNLKNDLHAAQLQIDRLRRRLEEREIEIDKLRCFIRGEYLVLIGFCETASFISETGQFRASAS